MIGQGCKMMDGKASGRSGDIYAEGISSTRTKSA
jgi:hypothetical protein